MEVFSNIRGADVDIVLILRARDTAPEAVRCNFKAITMKVNMKFDSLTQPGKQMGQDNL